MKRLAILVPYRNREEHLGQFIPYMNDFLRNKNIHFRIVVVEQSEGRPFNKAKLLNVGFDRLKTSFDYFCFHDVDMLPENEDCDYSWVADPTHLAVFVSQFGYRLPYPGYFGGVQLFNRADFERINGFSNDYWGWGMEDDDVVLRCALAGLRLRRRPGRFVSLWHEPSGDTCAPGNLSDETIENRRRFFDRSADYRYEEEGLNTLEYEVRSERTVFGTHQMITVDI